MQKSLKRLAAKITAALALASLAFMPIANAEPSIVMVTPSSTQGWSPASTNTGGDVNFIEDATSPMPDGALELTTDVTTTSKAQYMHAANAVPLSSVTSLSYQTKYVSGPAIAAASYQLVVDLNGAGGGGFATLVYEPYQNGTVATTGWQTWDVDAGQFWSTRTFNEGACSTTNGAGGPPFYTLAGLIASCPNAVVNGYGVNIGSNNPSYIVETDAFVFSETTYNFEQDPVTLANKDQCKNGGWQESEAPVFKNQGDCVSSFASQGKAKGNPNPIAEFFRDLF